MVSDKLKTRTEVKKRKPTYKRVQSHQFAKLSETKWRRPKGMGNKVRRGRKGKPSMPEVGYGSPKEVRGFNKAGYEEVIVSNVADLANVGKGQAAVISSTVGGRKKMAILTEAKAKKIVVSNVKDLDAALKALTKVKKEKKSEKKETKATPAKNEEKKAESKEAKK